MPYPRLEASAWSAKEDLDTTGGRGSGCTIDSLWSSAQDRSLWRSLPYDPRWSSAAVSEWVSTLVWKGIFVAVYFFSVRLQISRRRWHWSAWNFAWWYRPVARLFTVGKEGKRDMQGGVTVIKVSVRISSIMGVQHCQKRRNRRQLALSVVQEWAFTAT